MLLNIYTGCIGALIQDSILGAVEEEACHANALLLTCTKKAAA